MAASSVLAFWVIAILFAIVPGTDWAFTISAALRGHRVRTAVSGLATGYAVLTIIVAAGVGAMVAGTPLALTGLAIVGGVYLAWHGAMTIARPSALDTPAGGPVETGWTIFGKGVVVSGLNPKGLLTLFALLPQFTNPHASWPVVGQIGVLGLVFVTTCAVFYLFLGSAAQTILDTRPAVARAVSRFSGAAMFAIGATLLLDRLLTA
jgi:threonine/homoserine/homoserine lactone efflux protein